MPRVRIFSVDAEHTTAKYFYRCIESRPTLTAEYSDYEQSLSSLKKDDLFFFIDPAPRSWPVGFEYLSGPSSAYLIDVHINLRGRMLWAPFFDVLFVAQKDYVSKFIDAGFPSVFWLPLACDPQVHCVPAARRDLDVGFVGNIGVKGSFRYETLSNVLPQFRTNDYNQFHTPHEMAEVYGRSKIVLNASINGDLNMRVFEALASGALLVTDRIQNGLSDCFLEDVHYVGFSSAQEASDKIDYYLAHVAERESIARNGQTLALAEHTYSHRWQFITNLINSGVVLSGAAPVRHYSARQRDKAYARIYEQLHLPLKVWQLISPLKNGLGKAFLLPVWIRATAKKLRRRVQVPLSFVNISKLL